MKKKHINSILGRSGTTALVLPLMLMVVAQTAVAQKGIVWHSMQKAQQLAKQNNQKVLIYAGSDRCVYCQKMDTQVLSNQEVVDSLKAYFYGVRLNIGSRQPIIFNGKQMTPLEFAQKHSIRATPTFFFVSSDGDIIAAQPGFIPADTFSRLLGYIGSEAYEKIAFGTYLQRVAAARGDQP